MVSFSRRVIRLKIGVVNCSDLNMAVTIFSVLTSYLQNQNIRVIDNLNDNFNGC